MDDTRFGCRGSSPHTRGAHRHQSSEHAQSGIIPAYAGSTFSPTRRRSRMADHPRIRGEHRRAVGDAYGTEGSSPHTRGALVAPDRCDGRGRIIPAYAGSTVTILQVVAGEWDHPRIRGEHYAVTIVVRDGQGSSPHTRGAPNLHPKNDNVRGIIPAYAGSTTGRRLAVWQGADHPRIRGEHIHPIVGFGFVPGSSPHTRGARFDGAGPRGGLGIIPAYAGSTGAGVGRRYPPRDHPRIRGEHQTGECRTGGQAGSSPHTRGALDVAEFVGAVQGIIPAYAGSTWVSACPTRPRRDHPRIRGEHQDEDVEEQANAGSSPHTRGAPTSWGRPTRWPRIIPAYAGSTTPGSTTSPEPRDHPRIRGEHVFAYPTSIQDGGSSPHTRGARIRGGRREKGLGIIPAYAGSTRKDSRNDTRFPDHPRIRGEHFDIISLISILLGSSPHTRGAPETKAVVYVIYRIIPAYAGSTRPRRRRRD